MNIPIYIVECVLMCLVFGICVIGSMLKSLEPWVSDYPPEIQERYYQTQGKEKLKDNISVTVIIRKAAGLILFVLLFAWMIHIADGDTFFKALFMTYGYMFVIFAFDTFLLDWVLFANFKKLRLPGTENMDEEYHQKWFHIKVCMPMIPIFLVGGIITAGLVILIW